MRQFLIAVFALCVSVNSVQAQAFGVSRDTVLDRLSPMEIGPDRLTVVSPPEPHELLSLYVAEIGHTRNICAITGISAPLRNIQATRLQIEFADLLEDIYGTSELVPRSDRMLPNATYELVWEAPITALDSINLAVALMDNGGDYHVYLRYTFADLAACLSQPSPSSRGL